MKFPIKILNASLIALILLAISPLDILAQQKKKSAKKAAPQSETAAPNFSANYEKPKAAPGAPLLEFNVVGHDEKIYFSRDIPFGKPVVLVLFNPSCGHCAEVAQKIKAQINQFLDVQFVFITGLNLLGELKTFAESTGIQDQKNIIVSADNSDVTKEIFEYKGIPQIMVYNKDHFLQKTFYKEVEMDSLRFYLNKM
ncbi:MAG: TlpA family protein disulfide reductase [Chitinophagaceae bacterium]|jgi:thiol-disulfide isomerase/thioredoxin